jgi:hypothetical protein
VNSGGIYHAHNSQSANSESQRDSAAMTQASAERAIPRSSSSQSFEDRNSSARIGGSGLGSTQSVGAGSQPQGTPWKEPAGPVRAAPYQSHGAQSSYGYGSAGYAQQHVSQQGPPSRTYRSASDTYTATRGARHNVIDLFCWYRWLLLFILRGLEVTFAPGPWTERRTANASRFLHVVFSDYIESGLGSYRYGQAGPYDDRTGSYQSGSDWYHSSGYPEPHRGGDWGEASPRGYQDNAWGADKYAERDAYYHSAGYSGRDYGPYPQHAGGYSGTGGGGRGPSQGPTAAPTLSRQGSTGSTPSTSTPVPADEPAVGRVPGRSRFSDVPAAVSGVSSVSAPPPVPPPVPKPPVTQVKPAVPVVPPPPPVPSAPSHTHAHSWGSTTLPAAALGGPLPSSDLGSSLQKDPLRLKRAFSDGVVPSASTAVAAEPSAQVHKKSKHDAQPSSHAHHSDSTKRRPSMDLPHSGSKHTSHTAPAISAAPPAPAAPVSTTSLFDTLSKFKSSAPSLTTTTLTGAGSVYTGITGALSIETPLAPSTVAALGSLTTPVARTPFTPSAAMAELASPGGVDPLAAPVTPGAPSAAPTEEVRRPRVAWGQGKSCLRCCSVRAAAYFRL